MGSTLTGLVFMSVSSSLQLQNFWNSVLKNNNYFLFLSSTKLHSSNSRLERFENREKTENRSSKVIDSNLLIFFMNKDSSCSLDRSSIHVHASHPAAPGSILGTSEFFQTEIYWVTLLSQWTVPIKQTHLAQSRGLQIQLGCTPSQCYQKVFSRQKV